MLSPARENQKREQGGFREKTRSLTHGMFFLYEGQQGAANGQDFRDVF